MSKATDAFKNYGFVPDSEGLVRVNPLTGAPRTRYVAVVGGGFHRYEREDGAWRQYPYSIHADWEGVGGLAFDAKQGASDANAKVKPECFEWVYPEAFIVAEYGG